MVDCGCFGYGLPTVVRAAVVGASNVEALAADDAALQHCGPKVVYGHVTTWTRQTCLDTDHI